ncbi:MAG TPA: pentapeptide repeat-containing protein [Dehalococcoidia bacterium]|nr:pentapeptide repeat-containing protein [Dehalococcoidia bacterium]
MADPAAVAAAREGRSSLDAYCRANPGKLDLSNADLSNAELSGANLGNANLDGVDFSGANLEGVRFNSSSIRNANFSGANINAVSFHKCDLTGSDLRAAAIQTWGMGEQRLCVSPQSFEGVHWSRDQLEGILEMINLNPDWRVDWSISPREAT